MEEPRLSRREPSKDKGGSGPSASIYSAVNDDSHRYRGARPLLRAAKRRELYRGRHRVYARAHLLADPVSRTGGGSDGSSGDRRARSGNGFDSATRLDGRRRPSKGVPRGPP